MSSSLFPNLPLDLFPQLTCTQCTLHLDGLLFHETLDTTTTPGTATPATTTRVTPCVTLDPVTSSTATGPNRPRHLLQLRFATRTRVATAGLVVQYAACGTTTTFSPLRAIMAPAPWYKASGAPPTTGDGSIQCDLWDYDAIGRTYMTLGPIPRREDNRPVASFRMPSPKATYSPCWPVGTFCPAGKNFTVRTNDIIAPESLPSVLYIRCWFWWSRGFSSGLMSVRAAQSLATAVYVGGQQVWRSLGYGDDTPISQVSRAPNVTMMSGNYRQLVAFEWHGVTAYSRLSILDGTVEMPLDGRAMIIDTSFMAPNV